MWRLWGIVALVAGGLTALGCTYEGSVEPPGPVNRFDPVAALPQVLAYVGPGAQLIKLEVLHARADGTVDLEADYYPGWTVPVRYHVIRPAQARPDRSLPVGARPQRSPHEGFQVEVMKPHWRSVTTNRSRSEKKHRGMVKSAWGGFDPTRVAPRPACSLANLWTEARRRGAPADAVATIRYDRDGYHFAIPTTAVSFALDARCQVKGTAPAGRGR